MHKIPHMCESGGKTAYYFVQDRFSAQSEITFYIRNIANWRHNHVTPNQTLENPMFSEKDRRVLLSEESIVNTRGFAQYAVHNYNNSNWWGVDIPWD